MLNGKLFLKIFYRRSFGIVNLFSHEKCCNLETRNYVYLRRQKSDTEYFFTINGSSSSLKIAKASSRLFFIEKMIIIKIIINLKIFKIIVFLILFFFFFFFFFSASAVLFPCIFWQLYSVLPSTK